MLMFDNAIFASLIPQFLMILGFFSVIIAPSLTSLENNTSSTEKELIIEQSTVSSLTQNLNAAYHFQNYLPQTQGIVTTKNVQLTNNLPIKEIFYFFFDVLLLKNNVYFSLFSRPPPFFF